MERASGLGDKLGPILFQFPARWKANIERLEAFLRALEPYRSHRFAFEFRERSWLTARVYERLEAVDAALCLPVHPSMPLEIRLTAGWTYVRFHTGKHGTGFTDAELGPWAGRLRDWRQQGIESYVYFNNDPEGHALADAVRLRSSIL